MQMQMAGPAKMLLSIVGRRRGDQVVEIAKRAGARGGTIAMGTTQLSNKVLQALSLADVQVDIVFIVMGTEAEAVVSALKKSSVQEARKLRGVAAVMDVAELFTRIQGGATTPLNKTQTKARSSGMDSGFSLICAIVNNGFGDEIMAAARRAGATGGTILNARGTGTEEDVKFFGITLVPEKEMVLMVVEKSQIKTIVDAAGAVPALCEPGGGIIFTLNVEEFIQMGG